MKKNKTVLEKDLIKDLKRVDKKYKKQFPDQDLTRDYYTQHGEYTQRQYSRCFGSFTNFKNTIKVKIKESIEIKRNSIDIKKNVKKESEGQTYFVSSIIAGAKIDEHFMNTALNFCELRQAKLILLVMRGVSLKDTFSDEVYDKYNKYFATEVTFNNNLKAIDFLIPPQQIKPLTGIKRFAGGKTSIILASPKQFLETIPKPQNKLPHIVLTTGTICKPQYSNNKQGRQAKLDNIVGGLVVEVKDKENFHIRHIQSDRNGGFQDLDTYYHGEMSKVIAAEAISCEPHYGEEDGKSLQATKEIIKYTNCKRIFFHDIFDARSVNYHENNQVISKYKRKEHQQSLEKELKYLGEKLSLWNIEFPNLKLYIVKSNHEKFITKWLNDGDFGKDTINVYLGCELMQAVLRKENPIEYYLKTRFPDIKNLIFLETNERFLLDGIELSDHGDRGNNGGVRGSDNSLEVKNNKCTSAHSHTPSIYRGVYRSGCNCKLVQTYNEGQGSSWLHGNVIQYQKGLRQQIIIINGEWKI